MSLAKATFGTAVIPEEWISTENGVITPVSDTIIKPEGGGDRLSASKRTGGPGIKVI
jgi:hypothetical protein